MYYWILDFQCKVEFVVFRIWGLLFMCALFVSLEDLSCFINFLLYVHFKLTFSLVVSACCALKTCFTNSVSSFLRMWWRYNNLRVYIICGRGFSPVSRYKYSMVLFACESHMTCITWWSITSSCVMSCLLMELHTSLLNKNPKHKHCLSEF